MAKKQKKEYAKIVILGVMVLILSISTIFTRQISTVLMNWLYKAKIVITKDDIVVHYINVGQGDAIALSFPDDKIMLIDAGPKDSQNILLQYIKKEVIKSANDLVIDYVILTHPDVDHSGGLSMIFSEFEVKNFYRPNIASLSENSYDFIAKTDSVEYDEAIKLAKTEAGLETKVVNREFVFSIGEAKVEIFAPLDEYETTNDMSCVTKVSYMDKSLLFTGDIQNQSEQDMLNAYRDKFDADVLKVAHHGSKTSTSEEFVNAVSPEYAIICVGQNNYGHPHFSTIATLNDINAQIYTTLNGTVRLVCGQRGIEVLNNQAQSAEFVNWWIIAVALIVILLAVITKIVLRLIRNVKEQSKSIK